MGFGLDTDPTNTALTVRPHPSVIDAGAPGSTAALGQDTVDEPLAGGVSPPLYVTV